MEIKKSSVENLNTWLEGKYVSPQVFKDSLQVALIHIQYIETRLLDAENLLSDAHDLLDDIHGYDSDIYREISRFLYGGGQ
jgi:hypothetical protein